MPLCHIKNSELAAQFQKYKGRVVFRGDITKKADGSYAVFSDQGTSSTHMAGTKMVDAVARMPGMIGEDADAIGAYTQIKLADADRLLGMGEIPKHGSISHGKFSS